MLLLLFVNTKKVWRKYECFVFVDFVSYSLSSYGNCFAWQEKKDKVFQNKQLLATFIWKIWLKHLFFLSVISWVLFLFLFIYFLPLLWNLLYTCIIYTYLHAYIRYRPYDFFTLSFWWEIQSVCVCFFYLLYHRHCVYYLLVLVRPCYEAFKITLLFIGTAVPAKI